VSCLNAQGIPKNRSSEYATIGDFRELFIRGSRGFYLLSILLTADHEKAVRCLIASLDECINGNSAFREWAHSRARRTIVRNAVRMFTFNFGPSGPEPSAAPSATSLQDSILARVLALEDFERFVFVLSILEKYSDQNCAVLLNVSPQRIRVTRNSALKHVAHLALGESLPAGDWAGVGAA